MNKLLLLLFAPTVCFGQYEIKFTTSSYADLDVKFTSSSYADIDVRFVSSEYSADFTVGFTNTKSKATAAITNSSYADIDIRITESSYADIDIRITESSYADVDIMIKESGVVDYLIYSDKYLDKSEIIVACLPIIKAYSEDKLKEDKIPLFFKNCGNILAPKYNTYISDDFEGWDYDNAIYELDNGLSVSSNTYKYSYSYRPSIQLYYCDGWYASVDGGELEPVIVYN
jgi:hypothetical protein